MKPLLLIFIIAIAFSKNAISQTNAEQTTYYEYDALGNTISLSDNTGSIIENYKYSAFGEPVIADVNNDTLTASAFGNRFMFTGREFIQQLNLYDYRNRVYSAYTGRFIQTDPLRYEAGDYTLYRYVDNNSINITDPSGLGFVDKNGNPGPALTLDNSTHWDFVPDIPECDGTISPAPPTIPSPSIKPSGGVVYNKNVQKNMHKDPDRESPAINSWLEWNEPLNVMSTKGRWIEVERQNGDKGWIYNGNTSGTPFLKEPRSNIGIKAGGATASTGARG